MNETRKYKSGDPKTATYRVQTSHIAFGRQSYVVNVQTVEHPYAYGGQIHRRADAMGLGCSRDYFVADDVSAIRQFMDEHGMKIVKVERI